MLGSREWWSNTTRGLPLVRGLESWGLRVLPVHTPILRLAGEPKSQKRPLCGSQGSRSVHSSPSCLAQTRQQPHPSSTRLTPAGQRGAGSVHWHCAPQSWPAAVCGEEEEGGQSAAIAGRSALPPSLPSFQKLTRLQRARRSTRARLMGPATEAIMVGARREDAQRGEEAMDEGRGRSLDTDSGRRLVSGRSRRWRLGLSAGAAAVWRRSVSWGRSWSSSVCLFLEGRVV